MKQYCYNLMNEHPKSIFKAAGILLVFYVIFTAILSFLSLILKAIFGFEFTMIFPAFAFLFAVILSSIYYKKTFYSFAMILFSMFFIFTSLDSDISDDSSKKHESILDSETQTQQNKKDSESTVNIPQETQELSILPEKTKEQIDKEIIDYIQSQYPEGAKYIDYIDTFDDWMNIILNTDSQFSDKYGNDYGAVLSSIHVYASVYSCGEDYWYDVSNFYMCDYDPYKIKIFTKSGKEIYFFGKDFDGETYPMTYHEPKKYP